MRSHWSLGAALSLFFAVQGFGQGNEGFLDVMVAKVKPEKRAEFDNVIQKMVEANRKNNGDPWIASETAIGEWNTIYFTSTRINYAGMEKGMDAFFGALMKSFGPDGAMKLFQDFNNCIVSARSEVRQRRNDLSRNVPADPSELMKMVGETRLVRTVAVRVRPGRTAEYAEQLRVNNERGSRHSATSRYPKEKSLPRWSPKGALAPPIHS